MLAISVTCSWSALFSLPPHLFLIDNNVEKKIESTLFQCCLRIEKSLRLGTTVYILRKKEKEKKKTTGRLNTIYGVRV